MSSLFVQHNTSYTITERYRMIFHLANPIRVCRTLSHLEKTSRTQCAFFTLWRCLLEIAKFITFTKTTVQQRLPYIYHFCIHFYFMDRIWLLQMIPDLVLKSLKMTFKIILNIFLQTLKWHLFHCVKKHAILDFDQIHLLIHFSLLFKNLLLLANQYVLLFSKFLLQIHNDLLLAL